MAPRWKNDPMQEILKVFQCEEMFCDRNRLRLVGEESPDHGDPECRIPCGGKLGTLGVEVIVPVESVADFRMGRSRIFNHTDEEGRSVFPDPPLHEGKRFLFAQKVEGNLEHFIHLLQKQLNGFLWPGPVHVFHNARLKRARGRAEGRQKFFRILASAPAQVIGHLSGNAEEELGIRSSQELQNRGPAADTVDFTMLKDVCREIFVPVTVGGRIRSIEDIQAILASGGDKVAINTYAIENPHFLTLAVREFGSQCIVLSIEAKKIADKKWEAYTEGGRQKTGVDVVEWAKKAVELGVGEILITSIDYEGTRKGYDLPLIRAIIAFAPVPVIAHGGAKNPESFLSAITDGKADAVSASSVFHYDECSVESVKKFLQEKGILVRI